MQGKRLSFILVLLSLSLFLWGCPSGVGPDSTLKIKKTEVPPLGIPAPLIPGMQDPNDKCQGDPCCNVTCGPSLQCSNGACVDPQSGYNYAPVLSLSPVSPLPAYAVGSSVTFDMIAYDPDEEDKVFLEVGDLPEGAACKMEKELNLVVCSFSWTPAEMGETKILFTAENRQDNDLHGEVLSSVSREVSIVVSDPAFSPDSLNSGEKSGDIISGVNNKLKLGEIKRAGFDSVQELLTDFFKKRINLSFCHLASPSFLLQKIPMLACVGKSVFSGWIKLIHR